MLGIGSTKEIIVTREEAHFDRACDTAYRLAVGYFGIDEDGHSQRVQGWDRSSSFIEIEFVRYVRMGCEQVYVFNATARKSEEDSDDDGQAS